MLQNHRSTRGKLLEALMAWRDWSVCVPGRVWLRSCNTCACLYCASKQQSVCDCVHEKSQRGWSGMRNQSGGEVGKQAAGPKH